jgi:hypothetical protein
VEYNGRFALTESDLTRRFLVQAAAATKTTAGAPYTNDGYIEVVINGTAVKLMTTAWAGALRRSQLAGMAPTG